MTVSFTVPGPSDLRAVAALLAPDFTEVAFVDVPGEPPSKRRPRFGAGRGYADAEQSTAETRTAAYLRQKIRGTLDGSVVLVCRFVRGSYQRIDVDNLLKHVCDSANLARIWRDDSQVKVIVGTLSFAPGQAKTEILVGRTAAATRPAEAPKTCGHCGKAFRSFMPNAKHCSVECANKHRGTDLTQPRTCFTCGIAFRARNGGQRYCGDACRLVGLHKHIRRNTRANPRPASRCALCGSPVSRPEYRRCRACWKKNAGRPRTEITLTPLPNPSPPEV